MTPHIVTTQAAQGDLLLTLLAEPPSVALVEVPPSRDGHVLAHSETGHHHLVREPEVRLYRPADDTGPEAGLVAYLHVLAEHADVIHCRAWDTHEPLRLPSGWVEVRRQRERAYTPAGWRRVED